MSLADTIFAPFALNALFRGALCLRRWASPVLSGFVLPVPAGKSGPPYIETDCYDDHGEH